MEAAGTAGHPAPSPPGPGEESRASAGWRALAVILALALAFACAVMVIAMSEIGDTPPCDEVVPADGFFVECFDGSSTEKTISLALGWPSGVLAGVAALLGLYSAATGRQWRLLMMVTGAAIALGGLSIAVGSI